jgi:branched-chain amino acid transport system substrate-binding protein
VLDSGTSTAGQYDPAQAATNAKKFVADPSVVAIVGPEMSGEGKADDADPVGRQSGAITPSSTNPDITDPKFAAQYKPAARRSISARSRRTPIRARTWPTTCATP